MLVLVASARPGGAQDPPPQTDLVRFNTEVVVTPERAETPRALEPFATEVIPAPVLLTFPAVTFGDVASFIPGFIVAGGEPHGRPPVISARGFFGGGEADYVLLLVDGVPVSDAESGLIDWSALTTASIRTVEAARGPGASTYGDSSVGGVIQALTTRQPGVVATTAAGSFGTFVTDAIASRRAGGLLYGASGAARRTTGSTAHGSARELVGAASAQGRANAMAWRATASANTRRRDDPGSVTLDAARADPRVSDAAFRFDRGHRRGAAGAFTLEHPGTASTTLLRVSGSSRTDTGIRTILLAPAVPDRSGRDTRATTLGITGQAGRSLGDRASIRGGVDLSRDAIDTTYRAVTADGMVGDAGPHVTGRRLRVGAFSSGSWDAGSRWRLNGALRWDHIHDAGFAPSAADHRAWSPRVGVVVHAMDAAQLALFAQASSAFKAATVDQLFDPRPFPDFLGGTFTISNAALRPQRAASVEAGVSGGSAIRWRVLGYRMNVHDEIDFDVRTFSYGNIGRSRHTGVEAEAAGRAGARVVPSITYGWTAVGPPGAEQQLKNVPRQAVAVAATMTVPWRFSAYARYRRSAGAFFDDENTVPIRGASTVDVRVRRTLVGQSLFLDATNLLNARYEEYGFTLTDFRGRVVPYAYPAAPRALRAGVSIAFGQR